MEAGEDSLSDLCSEMLLCGAKTPKECRVFVLLGAGERFGLV